MESRGGSQILEGFPRQKRLVGHVGNDWGHTHAHTHTPERGVSCLASLWFQLSSYPLDPGSSEPASPLLYDSQLPTSSHMNLCKPPYPGARQSALNPCCVPGVGCHQIVPSADLSLSTPLGVDPVFLPPSSPSFPYFRENISQWLPFPAF